MRERRAGRRRPVDHDLPARHGAEDRRARAARCARGHHCRRRLRPQPGARGLRGPGLGHRRHRPRRGRLTFRELLRALEARPTTWRRSPGCRIATGRRSSARPTAPVSSLTGEEVALPNRAARVLGGYTFIGRPIDVVETSRGCTYDCSFCSIIEMRGRNFHTWSIERVLADIADARARGARAIFIVDDNITLNVARFEALVPRHRRRRLSRHRLPRPGDDVVDRRARRDAGAADARGRVPLRLPRHREHPRRGSGVPAGPRAKNAQREAGRTVGNATTTAIEVLHRHGMYVVGGLIVGNPSDTRESIEANLAFARELRRLALHPAPDAVSRARR